MNLDKVFDFNLHLPSIKNADVNNVISYDLNMNVEQMLKDFKFNFKSYHEYSTSGNYMLFNTRILEDKNLSVFIDVVKNEFHDSSFTLLLDFRSEEVFNYLDQALEFGIKSIKFHSYIQQITKGDFPNLKKVLEYASHIGRFVYCIDTSYGTYNMYKYIPMELACFISETIKNEPIVLLHSGGAKCFEAFLLADLESNVYLETSLSLPFYKGSSLIQDFSYIYSRLGSKRVLYGSDFPYVDIKTSLDFNCSFFQACGFKEDEIEDVLFNNALRLING